VKPSPLVRHIAVVRSLAVLALGLDVSATSACGQNAGSHDAPSPGPDAANGGDAEG
jgi:hypothetical protein